MDELADLDRLSVAAKDELIRALFAQVKFLTAQVAALTSEVSELKGRLALNSRNSSKPSSTDGLAKPKPKSQGLAGQHPTGGQPGHKGRTLKKVEQPDHIATHRPPNYCDVCRAPLAGSAVVVETRQVFDLPALPSIKFWRCSAHAARLAGATSQKRCRHQCNTVPQHWLRSSI